MKDKIADLWYDLTLRFGVLALPLKIAVGAVPVLLAGLVAFLVLHHSTSAAPSASVAAPRGVSIFATPSSPPKAHPSGPQTSATPLPLKRPTVPLSASCKLALSHTYGYMHTKTVAGLLSLSEALKTANVCPPSERAFLGTTVGRAVNGSFPGPILPAAKGPCLDSQKEVLKMVSTTKTINKILVPLNNLTRSCTVPQTNQFARSQLVPLALGILKS